MLVNDGLKRQLGARRNASLGAEREHAKVPFWDTRDVTKVRACRPGMHKLPSRDLRRYLQNDGRGHWRHWPGTHETPLSRCLHGAPRKRRRRSREVTHEVTPKGVRDVMLKMPRQPDAVLGV